MNIVFFEAKLHELTGASFLHAEAGEAGAKNFKNAPPSRYLAHVTTLNVGQILSNMAGGKKKKKTVSNPARGFATTSIASKPRADASDITSTLDDPLKSVTASENSAEGVAVPEGTAGSEAKSTVAQQISPEEFERALEQSELQDLVDKHAQKSKRDAARQISRLQTERRLLRSQADTLNTRKWLPLELMEEILDLIVVDSRGSSSASSPEKQNMLKSLSEEDLTMKLWTLQQTLDGVGFSKEKILIVLDYILGISDKISIANKESVWGLEESLEWLARECSRNELPDYDSSLKKFPIMKPQIGTSMSIFSMKFGVELLWF